MATIVAPPLGLIPRYIWLSERLTEIDNAIVRYINAKKEIPTEWVSERNLIIAELEERTLEE